MMNLLYRYRVGMICLITVLSSYSAVRLYYALTGGFTISNITSNLSYDQRWETQPLSAHEKHFVEHALDQEYDYLGKGCQSYVFISSDGNFVLKFFKFQRFRVQPWIEALTFIPPIKTYQERKILEKKHKLDNLFRSWKIAFENLRSETGVIYVHLNKVDEMHKTLTIHDKLGIVHHLNIDHMEFLIQHRADMLCPTLTKLIEQDKEIEGTQLIDRLLVTLLNEYAKGYADNDHALMQNTGVWQGIPIHIDVGQFIYNESVKDASIYHEELYNKTYKFHLWLKKHHPRLAEHLRNRLVAIMGTEYYLKGPYIHKSDVAKILHKDTFGLGNHPSSSSNAESFAATHQ